MASYRFLIQKLSRSFDGCEFLHVPCMENEAADTLAKIASSRQAIPSGISLEHLRMPSVKPSPDSESIHVPDDPAAPQLGPGIAGPSPGAAQLDPPTITPDLAVAIPDSTQLGGCQLGTHPGDRLRRGYGSILGPPNIRIFGEQSSLHGRDRSPASAASGVHLQHHQ